MGSKTFDGVWFLIFVNDHEPPQVHGRYAGVQVIIDLLPDGTTIQSERKDAVEPQNAKRGDVRRILRVAAAHAVELHTLWKEIHGTPS